MFVYNYFKTSTNTAVRTEYNCFQEKTNFRIRCWFFVIFFLNYLRWKPTDYFQQRIVTRFNNIRTRRSRVRLKPFCGHDRITVGSFRENAFRDSTIRTGGLVFCFACVVKRQSTGDDRRVDDPFEIIYNDHFNY